uniref:ribonuclease P n=1 Tax=Kalanchoe fedtschenkoi TaxID=63787 RepID=A0A7N0RC66_KALFE
MDGANRSNKKPKRKNQTPEAKFRLELELCSKRKDLNGAIALYESALAQKIQLNLYLYNALLFLCSSSVSESGVKELAVEFGFRVFDQLKGDGVVPNEATITSVARLAAAKGDGELAFSLAKEIGRLGFVPKLRSYDPALLYFCENMQAEKAYEVEEHMRLVGVGLEEQEIGALLNVSSGTEKGHKVYDYLHKLRKSVRCVSLETADAIEDWFKSKAATEVESLDMDKNEIKEAVLKNGGGFHGLGWIGVGNWNVSRTVIDTDALCEACGEKLVCVDIDNTETEKLADSLASFAIERETKANFRQFMDWLDHHANYDAVVDGANIGLYQQNFQDGCFSIVQLEAVVKELCCEKQKKRPLVILHTKRLRAFMESPPSRKLLEEWQSQGVLYATPHGSNDDWYLLYAAVKLKCLVVTNDELRDHIYELLGQSFINQWKERHQVSSNYLI